MIDAIESVQNQTFPNVEHIVIDGKSTDGTVELLEMHSDTNIVVVSEQDSGVYEALNKGIKLTSSDIVGHIHSDDTFANANVLVKVMDHFNGDPTIDVVYGDVLILNASMTRPIRYWRSGSFNTKKLSIGWIPPHTTLFVRRSVFEVYGLYDPTFQVSGDYDFMLRILKSGNLNIRYIPEVLVHMRTGGLSSQRYLSIMKEDYRALKKNSVGGVFTLTLKYLRVFKQYFNAYRLRS